MSFFSGFIGDWVSKFNDNYPRGAIVPTCNTWDDTKIWNDKGTWCKPYVDSTITEDVWKD